MFNYQTENKVPWDTWTKILLGLSMAYFVLLVGGCAVLGWWESHNIWWWSPSRYSRSTAPMRRCKPNLWKPRPRSPPWQQNANSSFTRSTTSCWLLAVNRETIVKNWTKHELIKTGLRQRGVWGAFGSTNHQQLGVVDAYPSVTFDSGLNWWSCMTFIKVRAWARSHQSVFLLVQNFITQCLFWTCGVYSCDTIRYAVGSASDSTGPNSAIPQVGWILQTCDAIPSPNMGLWPQVTLQPLHRCLAMFFVCLYCGCCISLALPRNSIGCPQPPSYRWFISPCFLLLFMWY